MLAARLCLKTSQTWWLVGVERSEPPEKGRLVGPLRFTVATPGQSSDKAQLRMALHRLQKVLHRTDHADRVAGQEDATAALRLHKTDPKLPWESM
jgi:hypothetical protein